MKEETIKFLEKNKEKLLYALGTVLELASDNTLDQSWIPDSDWENGLEQEAELQGAAIELVWEFYNTL